MTTALVVDDSGVDRELVRSILQSGSSLDVQFADDGEAAVRAIEDEPPQIIVTDLHMPNVDGLQLVEIVRDKYASIPVVLVTGLGSEDLAVAALKKGAASYVPKASLAEDLLPAVMQVLAIARSDRGLNEVREYWCSTQCSFQIGNDFNLIAPLVKQLGQLVSSMRLFDETERIQLAVALEEAISNALYHGNLELTADDLNSVSYDLEAPDAPTIVDTRRTSSPYQERSIHITASLDRSQAKFTICDEGPGFDHTAVADPQDVVATGNRNGRGIAKMQLFTDELVFNSKGNEITLVKRC